MFANLIDYIVVCVIFMSFQGFILIWYFILILIIIVLGVCRIVHFMFVDCWLFFVRLIIVLFFKVLILFVCCVIVLSSLKDYSDISINDDSIVRNCLNFHYELCVDPILYYLNNYHFVYSVTTNYWTVVIALLQCDSSNYTFIPTFNWIVQVIVSMYDFIKFLRKDYYELFIIVYISYWMTLNFSSISSVIVSLFQFQH